MNILGLIEQNIDKVINWVWVPVILASALISVIASDLHREFDRDFSWFKEHLRNEYLGLFLDRCNEYGFALILATILVSFIFFVGILIVSIIGYIIQPS